MTLLQLALGWNNLTWGGLWLRFASFMACALANFLEKFDVMVFGGRAAKATICRAMAIQRHDPRMDLGGGLGGSPPLYGWKKARHHEQWDPVRGPFPMHIARSVVAESPAVLVNPAERLRVDPAAPCVKLERILRELQADGLGVFLTHEAEPPRLRAKLLHELGGMVAAWLIGTSGFAGEASAVHDGLAVNWAGGDDSDRVTKKALHDASTVSDRSGRRGIKLSYLAWFWRAARSLQWSMAGELACDDLADAHTAGFSACLTLSDGDCD